MKELGSLNKRLLLALVTIFAVLCCCPSGASAQGDLQAAAPPEGAIWLDHKNIGPMTSGYGVPHAMRSVEGKPLTLGGATYTHGVGTHAPSSFTFETHVGARFARLVADVGVDDEVAKDGSVQFQVWLDGKQAAQSPVMKGGAGAFRMDVDLTGAQQIDLRVTDGGDGVKCDHADWAGALLFAAPPPEQVIFDNFNGGLSDRWQATGTAFSRMSWQNPDMFPDQDLPWRGAIVGIEGAGFVNTTNMTDRLKATGKAVSADFTIKLPYIHVKVGGYQLPEAAGVRLVVDGQPVRTGTGIGRKDNAFKGFHKLKHVTWDVREFAGKTAHIEIYDDSAESFAMVDSIVFSSDPEPQYLDIPDVVQIDPEVQAWLEGLVAQERQNLHNPAIACCIVRDGQVVAMAVQGERKAGTGIAVALDDQFQLGSVSKTVTATLTAAMVEEGLLDWTTTVEDVYPEIATGTPYAKATVLECLTHTAGLPGCGDDNKFFRRDQVGMQPFDKYPIWLQGYLHETPVGAPGERYEYASGPQVVVAMLAKRTRMDYQQMLHSYLGCPLGLTSFTSECSVTEAGDPGTRLVWQHKWENGQAVAKSSVGWTWPYNIGGPCGGVNMSVTDQGRLIIAHMPWGRGSRILRDDTIAKMHTPQVATKPDEYYCVGCYTSSDRRLNVLGPAVQHHGSNGLNFARLVIVPDASFGYSLCTNTCSGPPPEKPPMLENSIADYMTQLAGR